MRICVSSVGKEKTSPLDARFGRCQYFMVYDTDTKEYKAVPNKGLLSSGGAGIAAAQTVINEKADAVITGNLGPNAMELLRASDITTYHASTGTVNEVVKQYMDNGLPLIDKAVPAHFGMGHRNARG